jgi:hypothetical protein
MTELHSNFLKEKLSKKIHVNIIRKKRGIFSSTASNETKKKKKKNNNNNNNNSKQPRENMNDIRLVRGESVPTRHQLSRLVNHNFRALSKKRGGVP